MALVVKGPLGLVKIAKNSWDKNKAVQVSGASAGFWELFILALARDLYISNSKAKIIVVLPSFKEVHQWFNVFNSFNIQFLLDLPSAKRKYILGFFNGWGVDRFSNLNAQKKYRIQSLFGLSNNNFSLFFATIHALCQYTLKQQTFVDNYLYLKVGHTIAQDVLAQKLKNMGYIAVPSVDEIGQYSIRGSIFDIFSLNYDKPLRIEFFVDKVESIRFFDPHTQSSDLQVNDAIITVAEECIVQDTERNTYAQTLYNYLLKMNLNSYDQEAILKAFLADVKFLGEEMAYPLLRGSNIATYEYINFQDILLFPKGIDACINAYEEFLTNTTNFFLEDKKLQKFTIEPQEHYCSKDEILRWIASHVVHIDGANPYSSQDKEFVKVEINTPISLNVGLFSSTSVLVDKWIEIFQNTFKKNELSVLILMHHEDSITKITNILQYHHLTVRIVSDWLEVIALQDFEPSVIYVSIGDIPSCVFLEEHNLFVLSERQLFGKSKVFKEAVSKKIQNYLSILKEIKVDDYVIHVEHGIGRYLGLKTLELNNRAVDFVVIEYSDSDKLYVPIDKLNLIQKYSVSFADNEVTQLKLDKLKGGLWEKRKLKVKKAVKNIAAELLKIYASRKLANGLKLSPIDEDYLKFEQSFPYEETPDQLRAISDINCDLDSPYPMDRLICGDVGFGKTEVALRAIYRVVYDGYQVVVLVPTTVLCYQHYRTFSQRLVPWGITVEHVNRFIEKKLVKDILQRFKQGSIDVLIGTHRILSSDVSAKNLGLLIIDEEQRFGVMHKEKLKALQYGCNVLTLTATPIPRTLHMAMLGLRDISIIATPPQDRLPIKTSVLQFDESVIKQAILFEIQRGGQVFFVHNRVDTIGQMQEFLSSLLPHVDIRVAHGQMTKHSLERVILDFLDQKFSVLLCSTIIEAGVDMPNVNTLIVNRADKFGLSQLYQLRGRVGRSDRQAYAYFLTPKDYRITDEARARLEILASLESLGVGFQIASYDLDIRGAGNLLGAEQSGYIADVGIDLYTQMLEEAIEQLSNKPLQIKIDPEIKINVSAFIPVSYVSSEHQRLQLYRRIFNVSSLDDIVRLKNDIEDRFGKMPSEVLLLFKIAELKRLLKLCKISQLNYNNEKGVLELKFVSLLDNEVQYILNLVSEYPNKYRLKPDYRLTIKYDKIQLKDILSQTLFVEGIIQLLDPLAYKFEVNLNE